MSTSTRKPLTREEFARTLRSPSLPLWFRVMALAQVYRDETGCARFSRDGARRLLQRECGERISRAQIVRAIDVSVSQGRLGQGSTRECLIAPGPGR